MKDIRVKDIMSTSLITLSQYDNLMQAAKLFEEHKIHHIPVVHNGDLVGVLSSVDFERSKKGKSLFINHNLEAENNAILEVTLVGMVMSQQVTTIDVDATLYEAYQLFKQHAFRSLPVMEKGQLVGIITPMDFMDLFFQEKS